MAPDQQTSSHDPFTQFWTDMAARMGLGPQPAPPSASNAFKQMQRVFLDAMAKYCDDFMRSPAFLEAMKQHMTNALTFQQQVNQFLTQAQQGMRPGAGAESAELVDLMRSLRSRIESLERKVEGGSGGKRGPAARRPSAGPSPKPKRPKSGRKK